MMRALYSAASGMIAQQTNVDVIANNLANVNSTGYKTSTAEFKSLLYQTLQTRSTSANGAQKPIPAQVGMGVRNSSITVQFTQGSMQASESDFAFAVQGNGLFALMNTDGETVYTRNGDFKIGKTEEGFMVCSSDGYPVLDTDGMPIEFGSEIQTSKLTVANDGSFWYPDEDDNLQDLGIRIGMFQFTNPAGLESVGATTYKATEASGEAMEESATPGLKASVIKQGYLEMSNVQVADEMVNLIVAQRAYEMNSKAIQSADEMLGQANSLKR